MGLVLVGLGALLLGLAIAASGPRESVEHRSPAPSLAREESAVSSERQNVLAEMWRRRIISPESKAWEPQDLTLLSRIRGAEAAGAKDFLRTRFHVLKDFTASTKPAGAKTARLLLTKEGYERYLLVRSQEALAYFQGKGVDAKWAFSMTDMKDRPIFDGRGLLTEAGEDLYNRVTGNLEVFWKAPSGEVFGTRRPPRPSAPPAAPRQDFPPEPEEEELEAPPEAPASAAPAQTPRSQPQEPPIEEDN